MTRTIVASSGFNRLVKYTIVGLGVNGVALLVFALLIAVKLPVWIASATVYILALLITYIVNYYWSFGSTERHVIIMPRFLATYGLGAVIQVATVWTLHDELGVEPHLAQIGGMSIVPLLVFAMLHWGVFPRPHRVPDRPSIPRCPE